MMLQIAYHEFRHMARSQSTLVVFTALFGLSFLLTANSSEFVDTARGGQVYINSPYMITLFLMVLSVFSVLMVPTYMANAVLRDMEHGFDGILFATPISERDFLTGRFLGAFAAMILALSAAPLGHSLGTLWPWTDTTALGPLDPGLYAVVFLGILTPSMLVAASFIFATAVFTRRMLHTYAAAFGLLVLYLIASETNAVSPLWDPFMHRILEETTRYWTASERNVKGLGFTGLVMANRILWLGLSCLFFTVAARYFSFRRFTQKTTGRAKKATPSVRPIGKDRGRPIWDNATFWTQFLAQTRNEVSKTLADPPFLIVICLSSLLMVSGMLERELFYDVNAYPLTRLMVSAIIQSNWWAMLAVLSFYSAEIITRERVAGMHEIIDALPVSNGVLIAGKLIALLAVMNVTLILGVGFAVVIQFLNGNVTIEWLVYFERIFFFFVLPYLYLAVLACLFQVITPNRLTGMVAMGLFILFNIAMSDLLGWEHPLLKYGLGGFSSPYSDMNGGGRFAAAGYWLRAYWGAAAAGLLLITKTLWVRGTPSPLKVRLRGLQSKSFIRAAVPILGLMLATGAYIYYQTNTLGGAISDDRKQRLRVLYEQQFRKYQDLPMPRVIDVATEVDLYPYQSRIESKGTYLLQNKTNSPIQTIHMTFPSFLQVGSVTLEGAVESERDEVFNYYIFDLDQPMAPGESLTLNFQTTLLEQGFELGTPNTSLVRNGTFIANNQITPYIGLNPDFYLRDADDRRTFGLDPLPRLPALEDQHSHKQSVNRGDSDFITFQTTVSTTSNQTAVAPGRLERTWREGARRYFSYKEDQPMMHFYTYLSAEYQVVQDCWEGVDVEIYHHQPHTYNLERMTASVKDSLDLFSDIFSPYQYQQLRILEFPAYRSFAQSFASTIPYSEGMGFVSQVGPDDIDMPYYVTAHETAHQWWGHQVTAANCQGASMLNETLAQYSALLVMEKRYGKSRIRRFLAKELDLYLAGRANDPTGELPLYKVEQQPYIHYRKGALVMYALRDYLGSDVVNTTLRRLIELRAYQSSPYATSADFLRLLRQEAGLEHDDLITDLFEKITLYDLRVENATLKSLPDGRFEVMLEVAVEKFYADSTGVETPAAFDLAVDLGLFLKDPRQSDFGDDHVIVLAKHRISGPSASFSFVVDQKPVTVGIDPYHKLIDRNTTDNLFTLE